MYVVISSIDFSNLMNCWGYVFSIYLYGSLSSTLWKYHSEIVQVLNVPAPTVNHIRSTSPYISCTSFPTHFRGNLLGMNCMYPEDVNLPCNQSPTNLTLRFLDRFFCLQNTEDSMTSSQLVVNNKFAFWLKMEDRREMSHFLSLTL